MKSVVVCDATECPQASAHYAGDRIFRYVVRAGLETTDRRESPSRPAVIDRIAYSSYIHLLAYHWAIRRRRSGVGYNLLRTGQFGAALAGYPTTET